VQRDSAIEAVSSPIWLETTGYARPKGATPSYLSLVPAQRACTAPEREHGPPLAFGSCGPPEPESDTLTVGTPDANGAPARSIAFGRLDVRPGDPGTDADEADVAITLRAGDVRQSTNLADFSGELRARLSVRITDGWNGADAGGGTDIATVTDLPFEVPVPCAATPGPEGGTCAAATTMDALAPGAAREGSRAIWELGVIEVLDQEGRPFLRQGVFVP
jgi:hypothetical protein